MAWLEYENKYLRGGPDEAYPLSLTVRALIIQLLRLPQDLPVVLEGCDCLSGCKGVVVTDKGSVLLTCVGEDDLWPWE